MVIEKPPELPVSEQAPPVYKRSTLREYFETIVFTAIIALFITRFVVEAYKIPTGSMENNLLIGDHLLVNKFVYGIDPEGRSLFPYKEVKRGDVVVFKYPEDPETPFVKRVIGLPGENVEIRGRVVYINNRPLRENYTHYINPDSLSDYYGPKKVPAGHYFVLGDNRDNSRDSRAWGYVPRSHIMGKAFVIYWSFVTDRNEHKRTGFKDRVEQIRDVVTHFFTKSRWERTLKVIK